ncbi:MAG: MBL fold metallo-hydrolase [Thermoleophilaceae bacterium]|nr:MBL fold metallo-hydrolase [Thermoleophilaceae bacterium]
MSFEIIDTRFQGIERSIACHRYENVLIDPGPESSIGHVISALGDLVPSTVLLTHVHLDHAGGTGRLVEHYPDLQVYIHEVGLPHMVDPSRLIASATRIYGDDMAKWGEVIPVPEANIHAVADGDVVEGFEAIHTPGHSGHHMAWFHQETEYALVGDLVGQTIHGFDLRVVSTPPPEVDIDAWIASLDRLAEHDPVPSTLGLTHFGRVPDVLDSIEAAKQELRRLADLARSCSEEDFMRDFEAKLETVPPDVAESLVGSLPVEHNYAGLERYWAKKAAADAEKSA